MKFAAKLHEGVLVRRYKRFLADVRLSTGEVVTIHCPNTGSMTHCAESGWKVWYSLSDNPKRKYPGTWELVQNDSEDFIGVNTVRANHLVKEALDLGRIKELRGYKTIKAEVGYGKQNSRVDFLLSSHSSRTNDCYVEVKSVTLLSSPSDGQSDKGIGLFPDAVSQRGLKHLQELVEVARLGGRAVLLYCVQHRGIREVRPAFKIDPDYCRNLVTLRKQGVEILAYKAQISTREISLTERIPVRLGRHF